jgi:hypothetical protein
VEKVNSAKKLPCGIELKKLSIFHLYAQFKFQEKKNHSVIINVNFGGSERKSEKPTISRFLNFNAMI